jgi:hypothetical protein
MAKATLEFDLNDVDDRMAHLRAVKSTDMALAIFQLLYNTRKGLEYAVEGAEMKGEEISAYDAIYMVFEEIHGIMNEHGINTDELIN